MKRFLFKALHVAVVCSILATLTGCAALKKKFTRKKKEKPGTVTYYRVRKYDIKPSLELYEKHYVFWLNWHRKLVDELGGNYKSDKRSIREMMGNLEDMALLLVDKEAARLRPRIEELNKARTIIDRRNLTKVNETRIRRIIEREYRVIKKEFSPTKMEDSIRKEYDIDLGEEGAVADDRG